MSIPPKFNTTPSVTLKIKDYDSKVIGSNVW